MANLETLEININANAESASKGLEKLITSLSALSKGVGKSVGALKQLNTQLATLKGYGRMNFGIGGSGNSSIQRINNTTKAFKAQASVLKEYKKLDPRAFKSWMYGPNPLPKITNMTGTANGMLSDEELRKTHPEWFWNADDPKEMSARREAWVAATVANKGREAIASDTKTLNDLRGIQEKQIKSELMDYLNQKPDYSHLREFVDQQLGIGVKTQSHASKQRELESVFGNPQAFKDTAPNAVKEITENLKETTSVGERVRNTFSKIGQGFKTLKDGISKLIPRFQLLNRIMRIATTMLIRMGVKALFRGAKEGFDNFYQYSKATGGAFATQMDGIASAWKQIKNQLGASLATAFSAAIPVINTLANAAITAFNYLSQLIALLTGKSSWTRATAQVSEYGQAVDKASGKGGGGGMKELLAQFDELNVIASESGGGAAGAAAQAAEDYANMFEEINQFDSKIRDIANFVKDVIGWIKDNIDVVLTTVGLIGAAILAWKLSNAFGQSIDLLRWIAGLAVLTVGVVLEFDFGKKLGVSLITGKSLNKGDIIEAVVGIAAGALGGFIIGGGVGAAVGLGITLTAFIVGVMVGVKDGLDQLKWGKNSLTPEQIEKYVQGQFKFDVEADIKIVSAKIENARAAKAHLDREIYELSVSIDKIKLGVEDTETLITEAKEQYTKVVAAMNEWTKEEQNLLHAYLKVMPYEQTLDENMLRKVIGADAQLNQWFENQGKKLADLYDKGMRTEWKGNEKEQILALMEHLETITSDAEAIFAGNKLELDLSSVFDLSIFDRDTANAILDKQAEYIKNFRSTMEDANKELAEGLLKRAAYAEAAGLIDETTGRPLAEIYKQAAKDLVDNFEVSYNNKMKESTDSMRQTWITTLQNVYAKDYNRDILSKSANIFINSLREDYKRGGKKSAIEYITSFMDKIKNHDATTQKASELFNIEGWDLLADDVKAKFYDNVYQAVGVDAVALLKESLKLSASEMLQISGWQNFTNEQRVTFIKALSDAYGTQEALRVCKQAGIDVAGAISDGMKSGDGNVKNAATSLSNSIRDELNRNGVEIPVSASLEVAIDALINVKPQSDGNVFTNVKNVVASKVSSTLSTLGKVMSALTKRATGGFVGQGDLFIANERGAELVGSIGGSTAVANQGQIIEGIQRGVYEANSEQNALLRRQNELLQGILEKDASVRIGASAALGRVARQSLDMYSGMVGG